MLWEAFAFGFGQHRHWPSEIPYRSPTPGFWFQDPIWALASARSQFPSPVRTGLTYSCSKAKLSHSSGAVRSQLWVAEILQAGQMLNKDFSKSHCGTEGSCAFLFLVPALSDLLTSRCALTSCSSTLLIPSACKFMHIIWFAYCCVW